MKPRKSRSTSIARLSAAPTAPGNAALAWFSALAFAEGRTDLTARYSKTWPKAITVSRQRPIRNRQRVSSQDLYQSMSVLRGDRFEKDLFERNRRDVGGRRIQRARLVEDAFGAGARQHGQD